MTFTPWTSITVAIAGWMNRQQQVIEYLREENRILREELGQERILLDDSQKRRLAVPATKLGRDLLRRWGMFSSLDTLLGRQCWLITGKYNAVATSAKNTTSRCQAAGCTVRWATAIAAIILAAGAAFRAAGDGKAADRPAAPPASPAAEAPARAAPDLDNLPGILFDDSVGDWVVDRFAGNDKTGPLLYQGPARETGGLGRIRQTVATPDGTVYIACGTMGHCSLVVELVKVTPDGTLRLVMEKNGLIEGPMGDCRAGRPIWNPKEKALYLTGPNCLRKVVEKPDGSRWVEVVAGVPSREGYRDGPAKEAMFQSFHRGVVCNSRGTFFWLESIPYSARLRRIENGVVSTVPLKRPDSTSKYFLNLAMGGTGCWLLSLGENDDTLYISDYYGQDGYVVLKCDVGTGLLTRVCGVRPKDKAMWPPSLAERQKRFGGETDGPALTHASGNSGMWGTYDAFRRAIWIGCPDPMRIRWLKLDGDGWVRTVMGARRPQTKREPYDDNGMGVPGEQFMFHYPWVIGFDAKGGVFVAHFGNPTGVWRAHNRKEVKP